MTETSDGLHIGDDGRPRCSWCVSTADYIAYHDQEWGRPTTDETTLFEKLCLEGFQSGLSWITILRKRPAFREVFEGFDAERIARFDDDDIARLLTDARIIRHRGKIEATINNARTLVDLHARGITLASIIWSHEPATQPAPESIADVPATTEESTALSKQLKGLGFRFVGPTTAYAGMQAMGIVNDHVDGCWVRAECAAARDSLTRPATSDTPAI